MEENMNMLSRIIIRTPNNYTGDIYSNLFTLTLWLNFYNDKFVDNYEDTLKTLLRVLKAKKIDLDPVRIDKRSYYSKFGFYYGGIYQAELLEVAIKLSEKFNLPLDIK